MRSRVRPVPRLAAVARFALASLLLGAAGCPLVGEIPGVFRNPSCQTAQLTFRDTGMFYRASVPVPNPVSNQYRLLRMRVTDAEGWEPQSITLTAPLGPKGERCWFGYPAPQEGFAAARAGGAVVFTAENPPLGSPGECSVVDHLGSWTLEVVYPREVAVQAPFVKPFEVCFEYATDAAELRAGG